MPLYYLSVVLWSVVLWSVSELPSYARAEFLSTLPPTSEVRIAMQDVLLDNVVDMPPRERVYEQTQSDTSVLYVAVNKESSVELRFIPSNHGVFSFPSRGAWVVYRSLDEGELLYMDILFQDKPGYFIRIHPQGKHAIAKMFLSFEQVVSQVFIPMSVAQIFASPINDIIEYMHRANALSLFPQQEDAKLYENMRIMAQQFEFFLNTHEIKGFQHMLLTLANGLRKAGATNGISYELVRPVLPNGIPMAKSDERYTRRFTHNIALSLQSVLGQGILSGKEMQSSVLEYEVPMSISKLDLICYFLALKEPGYGYFIVVEDKFADLPSDLERVFIAMPYSSVYGEIEYKIFVGGKTVSLDTVVESYANMTFYLYRFSGVQNAVFTE